VQLIAKQATALKKSLAQSDILPPTLVKQVPAGFGCDLIDGNAVAYKNYWLCTA
jgi:hypothetical protein